MPYVNTRVQDFGINALYAEGESIFICSQEPTTYLEATSTYALGEKDYGDPGDAFTAPEAGDPDGRMVLSVAISDGVVTDDGDATHWAVVDKTNSRLLAANSLAASQTVTSGNVFTLPAISVRNAPPTSE